MLSAPRATPRGLPPGGSPSPLLSSALTNVSYHLESGCRGTLEPMTETCLRCGAEMEWRQSTWQCPRCHFKLGCCEGEPQSACSPPPTSVPSWQPSSKSTS